MMQSEQITSIKDPRIIEARELSSASGRARIQKCLLEGTESIAWAMDSELPIEHVFYSRGHENDALYQRLRARSIPCYAVSDSNSAPTSSASRRIADV